MASSQPATAASSAACSVRHESIPNLRYGESIEVEPGAHCRGLLDGLSKRRTHAGRATTTSCSLSSAATSPPRSWKPWHASPGPAVSLPSASSTSSLHPIAASDAGTAMAAASLPAGSSARAAAISRGGSGSTSGRGAGGGPAASSSRRKSLYLAGSSRRGQRARSASGSCRVWPGTAATRTPSCAAASRTAPSRATAYSSPHASHVSAAAPKRRQQRRSVSTGGPRGTSSGSPRRPRSVASSSARPSRRKRSRVTPTRPDATNLPQGRVTGAGGAAFAEG